MPFISRPRLRALSWHARKYQTPGRLQSDDAQTTDDFRVIGNLLRRNTMRLAK